MGSPGRGGSAVPSLVETVDALLSAPAFWRWRATASPVRRRAGQAPRSRSPDKAPSRARTCQRPPPRPRVHLQRQAALFYLIILKPPCGWRSDVRSDYVPGLFRGKSPLFTLLLPLHPYVSPEEYAAVQTGSRNGVYHFHSPLSVS